MAKILLKFRGNVVKEIPIMAPSLTIGRTEENDIFIDNLGVSRLHAQITQEGDAFFIEDMESANGTLLNGNLLNSAGVKKSKLQDQDELEIGKHKLVFLLHAEVTTEDLEAAKADHHALQHRGSQQIISSEETVHVSDIKTKGYRRLTPSGLKSEIKEAGVEILEGGVDQTSVKFTRVLTVGGRGPTADIRIKGNYDKDVIFVISKRPEGFLISPSRDKSSAIKLDGIEVKDHVKLRHGQIIEVEETKMKFFINF